MGLPVVTDEQSVEAHKAIVPVKGSPRTLTKDEAASLVAELREVKAEIARIKTLEARVTEIKALVFDHADIRVGKKTGMSLLGADGKAVRQVSSRGGGVVDGNALKDLVSHEVYLSITKSVRVIDDNKLAVVLDSGKIDLNVVSSVTSQPSISESLYYRDLDDNDLDLIGDGVYEA